MMIKNMLDRLLLGFFLLLGVCNIMEAKAKNDTIYRANYDQVFTEEIQKSKIIGKRISQVLVDGHPNLSKEACEFLKISPNDTVIVLEEYRVCEVGTHFSTIKYGDSIACMRFDYYPQKANSKYDEFQSVDFQKTLQPPKSSEIVNICDMIMLNVVLNWDVEDMKCYLASYDPSSDYCYIAKRFILRDYKVTDYMAFYFDVAIIRNFRKCYDDDQIPEKYFRNLSTEGGNSLLPYMQGYLYDTLFWKSREGSEID